jgi:hypothetical protein
VLLAEALPEHHFSERHTLRVDAPAERVMAAVREVDPGEIPLVRLLFRLRGLRGLPPFETLAESPDELVLGLVGPPAGLQIVLGFRFDGRTLTTETRVRAGDARARRRFRLYWIAIRPWSGLIRRLWLREIGRASSRALSSPSLRRPRP